MDRAWLDEQAGLGKKGDMRRGIARQGGTRKDGLEERKGLKEKDSSLMV